MTLGPKTRLRAQSSSRVESYPRNPGSRATTSSTSAASTGSRPRAQSSPDLEDLPTNRNDGRKEVTLIGNDVTALYPSLSADNTAGIARKHIIERIEQFEK